jgi:PAS domain S-box-containing protein
MTRKSATEDVPSLHSHAELQHLRTQLQQLREHLQNADDTLRALNADQIDAIIWSGPAGDRVFTIKGAETPYRQMVEAMMEGAVTLAADGLILYCNERFAELVRQPAGRVMGERLHSFLSIDALDTFETILAQSRDHTVRQNIILRRPDGVHIPVHFALCQFVGGDPGTTIAVVTDLTELTLAEVERDNIARMMETAQDPIIGLDLQGCIQFWNLGAEKTFGYRRDEIVGKSVGMLVPADKKDEFSQLIARVRDGETIEHFNTVRIAKNGRHVEVELALSPMRDPQGELIGVSKVERDITKQRAAEAALRLSEERYRTLVTTTSQLVWTADVAGTWHGDMPSWREFTGQSTEQMQGSGWAAAVHPDDRQATLDAWADAVQHGSSFEIEHRLRSRTGEYRYFLARGAAVRNIDGSIREWIGASTDITERKQAEAQVRRLNAELEQRVAERTARLETANQDLESFSYSVSHDLRSPLRAINGFARILLDEYGPHLDGEGQRLLDMVADGAMTMTRMIDNVLVFSRVSRDELVAMDIDMAALVRNSLNELAPAIAERDPLLEVDSLPHAWGAEPMIQRVWTNLLDNALKYTAQAEQAQITIGTIAGQAVDEVVYFVRDNGVGFDMQYADKLFGVFERLHGPDFPGTGIGLAIVKRIVERHGGRIWADSKVDAGSTFYFALPSGEAASQGALTSHQDQRR